jgi:hypothetical protein
MQRDPVLARLVSVSTPVTEEYPQSPAERYIAIRSRMMYDAMVPKSTTSHSSSTSQVPNTASVNNQQFRPLTTANLSGESYGFNYSPDINVYPPSDNSMQLSEGRTGRVSNQENLTPLFQPVPPSNQSTDDYPVEGAFSTANSSTLRTQMSHEQHMQAWREGKTKETRKKRRHCYTYGPPTQPSAASVTILTAQIPPTTTRQKQNLPTSNNDGNQRGATASRFQYPVTPEDVRIPPVSIKKNNQLETINEKSKTKHQQKIISSPQQRIDRVNEDSEKKKSSDTTSALIHQEERSDDASDTTEA